ncbi:hypothetical protein PRNP1_001595 [Phytophthora ramorum]
MADAYRAKVSTSNSTKAAYGVKAKTARSTSSRNQHPPGAAQASVLPRIDRRGDLAPTSPAANSTKNGTLSILLPPRRPSSKETPTSGANSPTFHGDEIDGPSAKAAWCTPRGAAPELPTGSQAASFFAGPGGSIGYDDHAGVVPTPLRLQSVEDSISANEERYRVDMEQLASNNDKFFEISASANQHLEQMHNQLPNISEAFEQTSSVLENLSMDIATLHQQHENAREEMENQFESALSSNTDEMVALSEAHAAEKTELVQTHERESQQAESVFRDRVAKLEDKYNQMEKTYLDELQELRQTSEAEMQTLHESNRAEREQQERVAGAEIEALQTKARKELEDLQSSTQSAYQELQGRSQAEFAVLQRATTEELASVRKELTTEILTLKQTSAANLAVLGDRSTRELQELREQGDEALQKLKSFYLKERAQLLEQTSEEIARLRMLEIDQSTRTENRRVRETKALREELDATRTNYSTRIQELHRRYTSELEVLKATSQGERTLLLQTHASELGDLRAAAAQDISQTTSSHEDRLRSMSEGHAAELARNKKEATQAREVLAAKYESDLASLQSDRVREKDALILQYETELEAFKQASREEHDKHAKLHKTQVVQLREAHSSRVLALEMSMREQSKQAEDTIREKDVELESRLVRIDVLEAGQIALKDHHKQYAERSLELVEQKNMALCELESEIWRLGQLNVDKDAMLDDANRALKVAEGDLQVKANTILELTFVVKSRDDEVEKLRHALLNTVQTVNTKSEILELTTETLSSKAKELEATRNALRLESGRLSMVEESMHQKEGMLENTELKMESMRLNMGNMRLEMKRMQMDMKLQLEHTEGEIELKNGEIRRLHGTQSDLRQKNDFCQQTIERLEESLAFAQRQGEEAQRRIGLLRLEATQAAEEMKKVCGELLGKEQELVVMTREKQTISAEKQRLQIQFANLTHLSHTLHEKVELHAMRAEEIRGQCQKRVEDTSAQKDERMRSEKRLHGLELSAAKDMIQHLGGVDERLSETSLKLETVTNEKQHLEAVVETLKETLRKFEDTDRLLCAANEDVQLKNTLIEDKAQEFARLNEQLHKCEEEARHELEMSRMEVEDAVSNAHRLTCSKEELRRLNENIESSLSSLRIEKEQLALSLGHEKMKVVSDAEGLQEKVAGLRKEGARAASELGDLQHALNEKKKELAYLQENLGEQTADTRKIKSALDTLATSHTELQAQFTALSSQRERENQEHLSTIHSLEENLGSKAKECESVQQTLAIQRQEIDLLMMQHDNQVVQLTDGHRSEAVRLIGSHRAQLAQLTEDHGNHVAKLTLVNTTLVTQLKDEHLYQTSQLILDNMTHATQLKEDHLSEMSQLTEEYQTEVAQLSARIDELMEEHRNEVAQLTETHRSEIVRLSEDHRDDMARRKESHRVEINRLTDDLHYQVSELTVDGLSQITAQTEDHRAEVARLKGERNNEVARLTEAHRSQIAQLTEGHRTEVAVLVEEQRSEIAVLKETHRVEVDQLTDDHSLQTADEQVRAVCAHSLEMMTIRVVHQQEIASTKENMAQVERSSSVQLAATQSQNSQIEAEVAQLAENMKKVEAERVQSVEDAIQKHESGTKAARQLTDERYEQIIADHKKTVHELNETFAQNTELLRLRLTEEHLTKVNELLERSRVEEVQHAAALTAVRGELSNKSETLETVETAVVALKADISELQTQLQNSKHDVLEREADVAAKNATIDNVRKELNLLMGTARSTRSSGEFVALIRQQLKTHLMEVYHVELDGLSEFVLEDESDLLGCLKELFAIRCYRGVALPGPDGNPESNNAVARVDNVRELLREHDRVVATLGQLRTPSSENDRKVSPSEKVTALVSELRWLKLHVGQIFISTDDKTEDTSTAAWVQLLDKLRDLFATLAIPRELENAMIRSRQVVGTLKEHEKLMLDAKSSCLVDDIQSMEDVGQVFNLLDRVLARAREVTRSDRFVRLKDLAILFDEWEALHKELDDSDTSNEYEPAVATGNYLRSAEILAARQEAADFVQRCKDALQFAPDEVFYPDEVVDAVEQLMKIVHHFELLQPQLGSPRRRPTAADPPPTIENKVTAVLAFVDELRLMADFAQNVLSDECKSDGEMASNESSRASLDALRVLTRTPSPTSALEELQIDVELAVDDDEMQDLNVCERSIDEGEKQREAFFSPSTDSASSSSPFLADSLMDISLVMSDHHRLISQTARWVAKSRQGSAHSHTFSVGTEISRLVREHCALLSLARRLFRMKDPGQELVSLLEGVALLERMAARLTLSQANSSRDADEMSCRSLPDSYCGGSGSGIGSIESLARPVLSSIGDMARHLQDYDYFLQQVKVDGGRSDRENNSPAAINIEALVRGINERVMLAEHSNELLGLGNPVDELPLYLIGAQEVLRQAKQLRESSVCFEKGPDKAEVEPQDGDLLSEAEQARNGVDGVLSEMDSVVEDLQSYNEILAWMKQELPAPESVRSVADLKDRVKGILAQVETLTSDNANLTQGKARVESDLEQMKQIKDRLVEEASKEGALLLELAALQSEPSQLTVDPSLTRFELLESLIKRACAEAQQRRTDTETEAAFLCQHDLLSVDRGAPLSTSTRIDIYNRLLESAECLRLQKSVLETSLTAEKNAMEGVLKEETSTLESSLTAETQRLTKKLESVESELAQVRQETEKALAEERRFLESTEVFSSVLGAGDAATGSFSRIQVYQQLHDTIAQLLGEKQTVEDCATREYEFLQVNRLLSQNGERAHDNMVPTSSTLSSIRLEVFQHLVASLAKLRQQEEVLAQEDAFLQNSNLAFDPNEPHKSRLAVYGTLLAGQSALIEEKMEREVALESEKAFLASHGVPAFGNPMEIYEQFVQTREQLAALTTELEEELRFLAENGLCSSDDLSEDAASLTKPFSSSFRLLVYRRLVRTEIQAREAHQQLQEDMEQQLSRQIASDGAVIALLTAKVERLEASLMAWQETAYASQREWDRMRLEEEDRRRELTRQHEEVLKRTAESHDRALEEITKARDSAVALASATHAETLEEATKEHEKRIAYELQKQAQQLELAEFVHAENESHQKTSDTSTSGASMSTSVAQTRAYVLEKFAKRDTTAVSMIYKVIRLTTDILSAVPSASAVTLSSSTRRGVAGNTSEVSTDVTQTVLACVKELKALKEFLVQSLEHVAKDDDHVPPPFAKAPYAKWMADAVTRATADTECAIDLALCSHREFMSFAEVELLTRQEEVERALTRVFEKLETAARSGGFSAEQAKLLALELEVTREREARETVTCKFRLNEEYYRRLLDERKEMEIAQTANVEGLREESKALRMKLEKLEQQLQQQPVLPQFRPPSNNTYTSSPRASVMSPQAPRVLKSAVISNVPMPMRPERPRGDGSAHKDRFVSDLERETGQRRTNTAARRLNEWKAAEEMITESPGSQLEQDFRAMQAAVASYRAPAMEPVAPTAMTAPATAPGSSLQNQELWYQGVRSIHYVSFFVSVFHVPRQQLFRVEVFNSDTEQQQQTVYVTWTEMQAFLQESRKAVRLGIALPGDPEMAVTVPHNVRAEIVDVLFERVRVYGEGTDNLLLGFE